ncbi:hypothetical protein [Pseudoduganella sp. RAF53_2]|uniref:hypothetical protein n=1 Tax=unclassified Pseudoduganella TaxID=2637179 RepID=UPI003F9687E8
MRPDALYAKTPAGQQEVQARRAGLTARQRTLLIMLDGRKPLSALLPLLPMEELVPALEALLSLGFIADPAALVPKREPKLAEAKSLMRQSAEKYLGLLAADLVRRIEMAKDEAQVQHALGMWHMAMRDSKYGKDVAGSLLEQTRSLLEA